MQAETLRNSFIRKIERCVPEADGDYREQLLAVDTSLLIRNFARPCKARSPPTTNSIKLCR